jgi:uncharacterized protein (DUF2235 family)
MEQDTTVAALRARIQVLDAAHRAQADIAWQHYQRAQALKADNLRVSAELAEARARLAALEAKP